MPPLIHVDPDLFPPEPMTCPRCGAESPMRFVSPCASCTEELRSTLHGEARTLDTEYVPKMNVTQNAVALKDD